jgi:hypothetical protein
VAAGPAWAQIRLGHLADVHLAPFAPKRYAGYTP